MDVNIEDFILEIIKSFRPSGKYLLDKQVLQEFYETKYGIHDHINQGSPLSNICFRKSERVQEGSLYEDYLRNFVHLEVGKNLNLTFDQYVDRPRFEIAAINRVLEDIIKEKVKAYDKAVSGLKDTKSKNLTKTLNSALAEQDDFR